MGHFCFRLAWGWLEVTVGLVLRSNAVAASGALILETMGLSIGIAVCGHDAVELTVNAVEPVPDGGMGG